MEQDGWSVAANSLGGTIYGSAVQAGSIEGGVHIHVTGHVPGRVVSPEARASWEDLPDLPEEVRFLLRAQVQAAQDMPYRLPGARRPSLATVYVRQDLGSGAEQSSPEQPRPTPMLDGREQLTGPSSAPVVRSVVRPPSRTVREALDGDDHVLVTGGPGQGKSTLSLRLAADVAQRWASPAADGAPLAEPVVPLRLTARELAARLRVPFPAAVAESVCTEYGALLKAPLDARVLGERVEGCRWLLLVDGLDEVADGAERDRLVAVLATWVSDAGSPYRVVLTTRPIEGAALAALQRIGAVRYELQPFDEEALQRFADNWFDDGDDAYRFVRQIRAAHLDELVRVPLLATIAAIIFEQFGDRPLPDNQYELYEFYLKYLRLAHPATSSTFDEVGDPLLEHLGRVRLEADTSLIAAAYEWTVAHVVDLVGDWQDELIMYLAAAGPFVRRGEDLHFLHHSFAEHLAATAKARLLPKCFAPDHPDFARLLHAARPKERGRYARAVLLHFTRLHAAEANRLIDWLHSGGADQHLLAARLLAGHLPAGVEVIDAFLFTVRAWAMTSQYLGQDILAQASRAAHHPGIAGWLGDLMRDRDAPWQSRVEAATALASRLRGAESPDAITLLRAVVDDVAVSVKHRCAAAEALSECGGEQREAAERGLRSVLADLSATALDCRKAAVTLAGFGGTARVHAVEVLTAVLEDPWSPDIDLVEAATGLVEIGIEFHERCAEVFRRVLGRGIGDGANVIVGGRILRDAAIGLASLGAHQATDAVATLSQRVTDRRLRRSNRIKAAEALAELGPQHRLAVGEHLMAMSAEFGVQPWEQWPIAASLEQFGFHDQALDLLRMVLADRTLYPNNWLWAADTLTDLGPGHREEAAKVFRRVANHPAASGYDRTVALGRLVDSGEPHRTPALASLRVILADRHADAIVRCAAANELIRLRPEFHSEIAEHMLEIASRDTDPDIRVRAWRTLQSLGTSFRDRASAALLVLMGPDEAESWESHHRSLPVLARLDTDDHDSMAEALTAVLRDPARSGAARMYAASALVELGRRFHRTALDCVLQLLRSQIMPADKLPEIARNFGRLGSGPCAELAKVLRAVARDPNATAITVCRVAETLELLGYRADAEIIEALRGIVFDDLADPNMRGEAAVALERAAPESLGDAVAMILGNDGQLVSAWEHRVRELAALGMDVTPSLRAVLTDVDAKFLLRAVSSVTLAQLHPDLHSDALTELRVLSNDEFLAFRSRTDIIYRLVELDPATIGDAIAYHCAVLNDEGQPVRDRCEAASQLVHLDESVAETAFAALRRFATSLEFTAEEHELGIRWLNRLMPYHTPEMVRLGLQVAREPAASPSARSRVSLRLWGTARLEVTQSLLADRTASPTDRVGGLDEWNHPAFAAAAGAVLRDVLTGPETLPSERVKAAAALARLSARHIPEAASLLEELSAGQCAAINARRKLADLTQAWRGRIVSGAQRILEDENCSYLQCVEAIRLIWKLTSSPPGPVVEHTRQLAYDHRVADNQRVELLYTLRNLDGLDPLRQIRDDQRTPPAVRWTVANRLVNHAAQDRAASAQVLNSIATDAICPPTLRWRAARDLTGFGARGRELGIASLQAITGDETLPLSARVDAAQALGTVKPNLRGELIRLLRTLRNAEKPLARLHVLKAIGLLDTNEAAPALRDMSLDQTLNPGVRLRAADAMAELRRDYRDEAAVVAREVAHNDRVRRHVRIKAARALARWSEPCLSEARTLLVQLSKK